MEPPPSLRNLFVTPPSSPESDVGVRLQQQQQQQQLHHSPPAPPPTTTHTLLVLDDQHLRHHESSTDPVALAAACNCPTCAPSFPYKYNSSWPNSRRKSPTCLFRILQRQQLQEEEEEGSGSSQGQGKGKGKGRGRGALVAAAGPIRPKPQQTHGTDAPPTPSTVAGKMEMMAAWFSEFDDTQKNTLLRMLVNTPAFGVSQAHHVANLLGSDPHAKCASNCQDVLAWLPDHISIYILSFLDANSLCAAMQVNKHWHCLASDELLWKNLATLPMYRLSQQAEAAQRGMTWRAICAMRVRLYRNWMKGRCSIRTFAGHEQGITCIQFDGQKIASGSSDATIKVWSRKTNAPWSVMTLRGHTSAIRCISLHANQLVSGSNDSTIRVWDLFIHEELNWSRASCRFTITGHTDAVRCLQADHQRIVSGSYDGTVKIFSIKPQSSSQLLTGDASPSDTTKWKCLHTLRGHDGPVLSVFFQDNMIISGGMDTNIKIWELSSGACLKTLSGHRGGVTSLQYNHFGRKIFSGALDGDLRFWDLDHGTCMDTLDWIRSEGHTGVIRCLQADRWRLVSGSDDKCVKIWDFHTGQRLVTLKYHTAGVTCIQ